MSSHFMPSPRSWMIFASSSGDHFDCFFAGDSAGAGWVAWRFNVAASGGAAATTAVAEMVTAVAGVPAGGGTELDRVSAVGEVDVSVVDSDSSSSLGLSRREISTVAEHGGGGEDGLGRGW